MLTPDQLDRVVVVLVRARNPNNIGAVARAMHDLGFRHLRIVNDYAIPFHDARSAVDASSVLAAATEHPTVAAAVADCTLVVGTSAVGERDLNHPLHTVANATPLIHAALTSTAGRVALLFGSEKTGLSNDELSHCTWLMTIPMHRSDGIRHPSMNLGQAAAVCLYELIRNPTDEHASAPPPQTAAADLERLTTLLLQVLDATGYSRRHPANCDPALVRRLVRRMNPGPTDAPIWMGILRQVLWKASSAPPPEGQP